MCSLNATHSTENQRQSKAEYSALNKTFIHLSKAQGPSGNGGGGLGKNVIGGRQDGKYHFPGMTQPLHSQIQSSDHYEHWTYYTSLALSISNG